MKDNSYTTTHKKKEIYKKVQLFSVHCLTDITEITVFWCLVCHALVVRYFHNAFHWCTKNKHPVIFFTEVIYLKKMCLAPTKVLFISQPLNKTHLISVFNAILTKTFLITIKLLSRKG